jgi:hypothetical protein
MSKSRILGFGLVLSALLSAFTASATPAYPCNVGIRSYDGAYGDFGYVSVEWYSEPHCDGSYLGFNRYCSTGATSSSCSSASYCIFNEPVMLSGMFEALAASARSGELVDYSTAACIGGGSGCGCSVYIQ